MSARQRPVTRCCSKLTCPRPSVPKAAQCNRCQSIQSAAGRMKRRMASARRARPPSERELWTKGCLTLELGTASRVLRDKRLKTAVAVTKAVADVCTLHAKSTTRGTTTPMMVAKRAVAAKAELKTVAVQTMMKAVAVETEVAWSRRRLLANLSLPDRQRSKRRSEKNSGKFAASAL